MHAIFDFIIGTALSNSLQVFVLAVVVWGVTRFWRNAHVVHFLWLIVLLKMLTPPFLSVEFQLPTLPEHVTEFSSPRTDPPANMLSPETWETSDGIAMEQAGILLNDDYSASNSVESVSVRELIVPVSLGVWLAGTLLWLGVVTHRMLKFHLLVKQTAPAPVDICRDAELLATELGLTRCPPIRIVNGCVPPLVWALGWQPTIVLPAALLAELDDDQQGAVLLHELVHVRRKDHWVRWVEFVVLALYWWNPVAWVARHRLQLAEEECCDAWVTALRSTNSKPYATAIWKTMNWLESGKQPMPHLASGMSCVGSLKRRIEMIMNRKGPKQMNCVTRISLCLVALLVLPLAANFDLRADESEAENPEVVVKHVNHGDEDGEERNSVVVTYEGADGDEGYGEEADEGNDEEDVEERRKRSFVIQRAENVRTEEGEEAVKRFNIVTVFRDDDHDVDHDYDVDHEHGEGDHAHDDDEDDHENDELSDRIRRLERIVSRLAASAKSEDIEVYAYPQPSRNSAQRGYGVVYPERAKRRKTAIYFDGAVKNRRERLRSELQHELRERESQLANLRESIEEIRAQLERLEDGKDK